MDTETSRIHIPHFAIEQQAVPNAPYLEKARELTLSPQRPVSLIVDCARFSALQTPSKRPVDYLTSELKLWASVVGARPVESLFLQQPYVHLEPFELTRLLHEIACCFQVNRTGEKKYVVTSDTQQITSAHLALIKGLGFCCYQIIVPDHHLNNFEALTRKIKLIRDFNIPLVGLQFLHADCLSDICQSIKKLQASGGPDYICLGSPWEAMHIVSATQNATVDFSHPDNIDVIELGPEGDSHIDDIHIQNYSAIERYKASLEVNRLPIVIHNT